MYSRGRRCGISPGQFALGVWLPSRPLLSSCYPPLPLILCCFVLPSARPRVFAGRDLLCTYSASSTMPLPSVSALCTKVTDSSRIRVISSPTVSFTYLTTTKHRTPRTSHCTRGEKRAGRSRELLVGYEEARDEDGLRTHCRADATARGAHTMRTFVPSAQLTG